MATDGVILFNNEGFDGLHRTSANNQTTYADVWQHVKSQIQFLMESGAVDKAFGTTLQARDAEFQRLAGGFDEDHTGHANGMRNAQQIGNETGGSMVRILRG
ncbi:hypothetical protein [Streptomyces sp. RFCAC02]|uniref:hypothetical protein n=1 Tax=Streptomyces sp. RFCAC02 TaxID=2499143 RepID=UPI001020FC68|nr:hypothetical protein [Streptomyces sp. RFCAC02]